MTAISLKSDKVPVRPGGAIAKITKLAFPLMIGAVVAAGLQILKTSILTHADATEALYIVSMIQPGFILMLAFLEALAVTNQVFASRTVSGSTQGDIEKASRIYTALGIMIAGLLAAAFWGSSFILSWKEATVIMPKMALFVLSMIPYMIFEMRNAALRGLGRTDQALIPLAILVIGDLAITWVGVNHFDLGFNAVLLGNVFGPILAYPVVSALLRRQTSDAGNAEKNAFVKSIIGLTIGVAIPIFGSMVASSVTAAVIFPALSDMGEYMSSSFFIIVRLRILFIIPAIAIGSAIAILVNQLPENGAAKEKRSILYTGVSTVLGAYVVATIALFVLRMGVIGWIVPIEQTTLFAATDELMTYLIITFALLAGSTMLQVILEHLSKGVPVLIITIMSEVLTISLALWVLAQGNGLDGLVWVMNATAILNFILMAGVFFMLLRGIKANNAA